MKFFKRFRLRCIEKSFCNDNLGFLGRVYVMWWLCCNVVFKWYGEGGEDFGDYILDFDCGNNVDKFWVCWEVFYIVFLCFL